MATSGHPFSFYFLPLESKRSHWHFPRSDHPFFRRREGAPLIIAHRGDSLSAPENTLPAFDLAFRHGADVVEMDLKLTRDSRLVVMHDHRVDRVTNGRGYVRDYTLEELKRLDAGFNFTPDEGRTYPYRGRGITIPTLEEVLNEFRRERFLIDLHSGGKRIVGPITDFFRRFRRHEDILIVAESSFTIRWLEHAIPECAFGGGIVDALFFGVAVELSLFHLYFPVTDSIQFPGQWRGIKLINDEQISFARSRGLQFHVFTVNEEEYMRQLVIMGVDGIVTDLPARLRKILERTPASFE